MPQTSPCHDATACSQTLVCGLDSHWPLLRRHLDALGLEAAPAPGWSPALEATLRCAPPSCVLVGASQRGLGLCAEIRACAALAQLNVIALVGDPWSAEARESLAAGADDYLPLHLLDQLGAKLEALAGRGPRLPPSRAGKAIVADPDRSRRIRLGRAIRRLGLEVVFSLDTTDIVQDGSVRLVVANAELVSRDSASGPRRQGEPAHPIPWIICGTSSELHEARRSTCAGRAVGFYDLEADPSQLVFIANSLFCDRGPRLRRSKRLPYEGPIRMEQRSLESWGFIYNINRGGLYVRTLTPPPGGARLDLEFRPPFGRGRVLVEGRVVWRQDCSDGGGYNPGCGIEFGDLPVADAAALAAGYQMLLEDCGELFR